MNFSNDWRSNCRDQLLVKVSCHCSQQDGGRPSCRKEEPALHDPSRPTALLVRAALTTAKRESTQIAVRREILLTFNVQKKMNDSYGWDDNNLEAG